MLFCLMQFRFALPHSAINRKINVHSLHFPLHSREVDYTVSQGKRCREFNASRVEVVEGKRFPI